MKNRDHHLWLRDGVWYCRMRVGAEQWTESLKTGDVGEARTLRTAVLKKWNRARHLDPAERAAVLRPAPVEAAVKRDGVTVERLLEVYTELAAARCRVKGKPRAGTVTNNCSAFRRVFGGDDEVVGPLLVVGSLERYAKVQTADADDELDMIRARITAASNIAQALSVVAEWAEDEYPRRGVRLPDLRPLRKAEVVVGAMPQYALTEERRVLRGATEAGAMELAASRPALYAVFLLAYMGGLRAGEIGHARWSWLSRDAGGACWLVVPKAEAAWRVKSKPGSIRIAPAVFDWLQGMRAGSEGEWILPGATQTERNDVLDEFSAWMRGVGWARERFPKTTHELRKLAGVRWYSEHGAETCAKWLRDNLVTVLKFYADLDPARHPDPVTPAVAAVV